MKLKIVKLAFISLSIFLASCAGDAGNQNSHDDKHEYTDEHDHTEQHAHPKGHDHKDGHTHKDGDHDEHRSDAMRESSRSTVREPDVKLNNGTKWEANPETSEGIKNMKNVINKYSDQSDLGNFYPELSKTLITQFEDIFKECTMEGEAHDQLLNYLIPMKIHLEKIGSGEPNLAQKAILDLNKYLNYYSDYFK